ncbi:MAG: hypothetical protein E7551_02560 [Ruminococcaceae bacterium]|nr:hypothetical protein [Oscillospiraceae bacterium]
MTVIEFFAQTPMENIIASLTMEITKIIFVGDNRLMNDFKPIYKDFIESRNLNNVEIAYRGINRNNLLGIVEVLSDIVEQEEQCFFDLTGGEDLALVAMGMVFQKYPQKNIQMGHLNFNSSKVTDCDNDGTLVSVKKPEITIDELIKIHGGKVVYADKDADGDFVGAYEWDFSEDFKKDIDIMWDICRKDPKKWNSEIFIILKMCEFLHNKNMLSVSANITELEDYLINENFKYFPINGFLTELQSKGLINNLNFKDGEIAFSFKNSQVKKCLTKAGTVLELKVTVTALEVTRKDGSHIYTQCMNGAYIDWDGGENKESDTFNEIDVILLSDLIPIFISCKNGQIDDSELYKLEAVANRFGGENVKKVLISTYFGKQGSSKQHFCKRAVDMDIVFIDQVHKLSNSHFKGLIKQLVNS